MSRVIFYIYLFLLSTISGCSNVIASNQIEAGKYLYQAKECFSGDNFTADKSLVLPPDLRYKLGKLEDDDYLDGRVLKSGDILVHYQKIIDGKKISIGLDVDSSQVDICSKISVHEILASM